MSDAVAAAALERLEEHRRRLIADKVARGEAVLREDPGVIIITGACKKKIEKALMERERDERGREILFETEPTVIITGVPREDPCPGCDGSCVKSSGPADDPAAYMRELAKHLEPSPAPPMPQPTLPELPALSAERHRVWVEVRRPSGKPGDEGEIAEGVYVIAGNELWVEDVHGKLLATETLKPGDDAAAVARRILRAKRGQNDFYGPLRYAPAGIV